MGPDTFTFGSFGWLLEASHHPFGVVAVRCITAQRVGLGLGLVLGSLGTESCRHVFSLCCCNRALPYVVSVLGRLSWGGLIPLTVVLVKCECPWGVVSVGAYPR